MSRSLLFLFLGACVHPTPPDPLPPDPPAELRADPARLGPYVGFAPIPVEDARLLWFGALVYVPSETRLRADPAARAEVLLTPADFGVGEAPPAAVHYGEEQLRLDLALPPEILANPATPLLMHLGQPAPEGAVPAVWTLSGFGPVERPEGVRFNALVALAQLPVEDQARIAERLKSDPGSVVIYASRMNVAQSAALEAEGSPGQSVPERALNIAGPELLGWDFEAKACRLQAPEPWMQEMMQMGMITLGANNTWSGTFGGKPAVVMTTATMEELDLAMRRGQ